MKMQKNKILENSGSVWYNLKQDIYGYFKFDIVIIEISIGVSVGKSAK